VKTSDRDQYIVESVMRACDLLDAFQSADEVLRLRDLVARTGMSHSTAFRLLYTLERRGFIQHVGKSSYRSTLRTMVRGKYRIGYASQGEDSAFAQEWSESIVQRAAEEHIDLLVLDNGFDQETALRNVDQMIRERVDLVVEHQFNEQLAPIISARLLEARIPLIAMGCAHPGAVYFGGNNYRAGLIGGRALAEWARRNWSGQVDELVLLELSMAGPLLQSRLIGVETGFREILPSQEKLRTVHLQGSGRFGDTLELMRKHLRRTRARRIVVGAANDPCALGALRAFEEAGWGEECAVMGQGGSAEGRAELRRPGTRLIGTVAFFPETYGEAIIRLSLDILQKKAVPAAVFVKHKLLSTANVDAHYPNDTLIRG
jgi:ribose transport system substrate-binding protein